MVAVTGLTNKIFEAFACRRIGPDASVLHADYTIDCLSVPYYLLYVSCLLLMLLWSFGWPVYLLTSMYKVRDKILEQDQDTLDKFGFIILDYKPEMWFWEIVELSRKLTLTGLVGLYGRGTIAQAVISTLIAFIFFAVTFRCQPFALTESGSDHLNYIKLFSEFQVFSILLICVVVQTEQQGFGAELVSLQDYGYVQIFLTVIILPLSLFAIYSAAQAMTEHAEELVSLTKKDDQQLLARLTEMAEKGDKVLSVDTPCVEGEAVCIVDPADSRSRENNTVSGVVDELRIRIAKPLKDSYPIGTKLVKVDTDDTASAEEPDTLPSIPPRQQAIEESQRRRAASMAAPQWIQRFDPRTERAYYEHVATKKTQWTHPGVNLLTGEPLSETEEEENPVFAMSAADLNAARESVAKTKEAGMWKRLRDGNGRVYYFNERTKKTQWAMPELLLKQHQELEEQWESDDDANTAEI